MRETPTAERILSILADLYADQTGTEITYEITEGGEEHVSIHG